MAEHCASLICGMLGEEFRLAGGTVPAQHRGEQLVTLIEQAYEAALDPALWPRVTLGLGEVFGGAAALVVNNPINGETSLSDAANFHPDYVRSYEAHYGRTSPWVKEFLRLPVGTLLHRGLVPELELEPTEYYNEWLKPQRLKDCIGGVLDKVGTRLSYVAIVRLEHLGDFSEDHHRSFRMVFTNVARALRVHSRLVQVSALELALFDALDRAGLAAFAVDEKRRLMGHNAIADALLQSGTALHAGHGMLAARDSTADDQMARAVLSACHTRQGRTVVVPQSGSCSLSLVGLVMPLPATVIRLPVLAASNRGALILVRDPSRVPQSDTDILRQLFGLTIAEARLMGELASGKSLEEIGEKRNVRYGTLRAQLRTVMSKTDTRRQGELIALAMHHTGLNVGP